MTNGQALRVSTSQPVAPASARFQRQRERILDAATVLLNRSGVRGMTFVEVAQALDLTTTSVTYYFRYKEQLAAAVFEESLARLESMVEQAARETTPEARVDRYIQLHFDSHAAFLRGAQRPLAILSEIRALDEATRLPLIAHYQRIFRGVRNFFGAADDELRKRLLTARAHVLNEALFWSVLWLGQYAISDFDHVRRRIFDILRHGIAAVGTRWDAPIIAPDDSGVDIGPAGRTAFLRVATRLINDIGYRGASIERIAAELNVTKGSFYHHIDAKDDLVLQCFRDSYRRMLRTHQSAGRHGLTGWAQLAATVASSLDVQFEGTHPLLRTTALQAMPQPVRDRAIELAHRTALRITGLLVDGMIEGSVRPVDPLIASHLIMSTINAAYDIRAWANRQPRAQAIQTYASALTTGIFDTHAKVEKLRAVEPS